MRARLAILLALLLLVIARLPLSAPVAHARPGGVVLAQQGGDLTGNDEVGTHEVAQGQEGDKPKGTGQGGAEPETGPPWTYQMARLSVALLVLLALGIGLMYYRLIAKRQRGEI
jgi:4-amino-4-deoxy-L-arabinose transferase-like glycosyltransferase